MAYKFESITVAATAVSLTAANYTTVASEAGQNFRRAVCTVETAQIRFRVDGTAPTSAEGHIANVDDIIKLDRHEASLFQAIRTGSTSGVLKVSYEVQT